MRMTSAIVDEEDSSDSFPQKLWNMVEDHNSNYDEIIWWNEDGDGFLICESRQEFLASRILKTHKFKTKNLASFERQLSYYGFHKRKNGKKTRAYHHDRGYFNRNQPELSKITKRKKKGTDSGLSSEAESCQPDQHGTLQETEIVPNWGPLEGGTRFELGNLQVNVSVPHLIVYFGTKQVGVVREFGGNSWLGKTPPGDWKGQTVTVIIEQPDGSKLGKTQFTYMDKGESTYEAIINSKEWSSFFDEFEQRYNATQGSEFINTNSPSLGLQKHEGQQQSVEILQRLINTAARIGEEKFIRLVFGTSAGRTAFEAYKNKSPLPEDIADAYGHEKIASYFRDITERFSKDDGTSKTQSKVVNWLELVRAESELQSGPSETNLEELQKDDTSETAYFADTEASSPNSNEEMSASDDAFKTPCLKDSVGEEDEKQPEKYEKRTCNDEGESASSGPLPKQRRITLEDDQVPSEIKARGPRARLAFENALKTGKVKVYRARIMLIGQDRAGKTSFKKSLLGLPFDPEQQSTEGIEVDPSKFEVDVDQVKNWQRTDAKLRVSQFVTDLVRMVAKELQKEEEEEEEQQQQQQQQKQQQQRDKEQELEREQEEEKKKEAQDKQTEESFSTQVNLRNKMKKLKNWNNKDREMDANQTEKIQEGRADPMMASHSKNREPVTPELNIDPVKPSEKFTDLLVKHLGGLNLQTDGTTMEHQMTVDLWDFAGQHLCLASYPAFLSTRALYMLVYNLSKGLKDTAQPSVRQGNNDILLSNPNYETNLENMLSWLVSVSTGNKESRKNLPPGYCRPPVFIVGTHADKPHQDIKEMELQIQKEIVGKDYEGHVIRPFFSIDNTQGSSGEGVGELRKRMIEVLKQEPYMGEEVPLRWLNFEKVVQALVDEKTYYLNLEQLQTIIQKVCFIENEDEVVTMLDFYHDLGMIVKHRNTVVLQAQWLIDVFKQLITVRSFNDMEPRHSKLWREMETTGVLSVELVDHVFYKFFREGQTREDILNMMEQFGLIVKFATSPTDEIYFVPSQLRTPPEDLCKMEPSHSDPCPLYLHFLGGFVPQGFFAQLVSRCTRWCSTSGFKQPPKLYDGAARFLIEKLGHHNKLILICQKRFIKIVLKQVKRKNKAPLADAKVEEVAILVRRFLEDTMQNLSRELPWLKNLTYELCVECPYCLKKENSCPDHGEVSCTHEDCMCLLKILPDGLLGFCPNSFCDEILMPPQLEKWFSISGAADQKRTHPEASCGHDGVDKCISQRTSQELHPSTSLNAAQSRSGHSAETLKVALLANEWGSFKGGLSTINRTLAIFLAKHSKVNVTLLVPEFVCSEEDKRTTQSHNISIREAQHRPGFSDPLDWLSFLPRDLTIDIVIGHGAKLGKQAQVIREYHGCKWVQVVHTAPEELAMHKNYLRTIAKGEEKNRTEVDLCKFADLVVAVGPRLAHAFSSCLRLSRENIFRLTPGIISDFADVKHSEQKTAMFKVLTFGRNDSEDLSLKGCDIAASAIVELNDSSYCLIFVGAPDGNQDEVAKTLLKTGISKNQLIVRSDVQNKERLKDLFSEVDVAIMPLRTEGFGLTALEAMSAGVPILVSGNSGFGEALRGLPFGMSFLIDSVDPKDWAKAIAALRHKPRTQRFQEIKTLQRSYEEAYNWETQCTSLVKRMWKTVYGAEKPTKHKSPVNSCTGDDTAGQTASDTHVPQVKEGSPSDVELEDLSTKISEDWKSLGRRLEFDKGMLHGFHKDNQERCEKAYAMLIAWKERKGSAATYQVLHQALCHKYVGRRALAEKICCSCKSKNKLSCTAFTTFSNEK